MSPAKTNTKKFLTYEQAENLYLISTRSLQRLVKKGDVVAYRPGAKVLLDAESLAAWVQTKQIKPAVKLGRPRRNAIRR